MKLKKILAAAVCAFCAFTGFSLTGARQAIPDSSGEYVYYSDKSFTRESYIGFLYYDEGTIQLRYYAPKNETDPAHSVELVVTLNTEKDYVEMTGEKFISTPNQDDAEIINYLHDLIYELAGRRAKISDIPLFDYSTSKANACDEGFSSKEEFPQFGGNVTIVYDNLIPIFNIKKIVDYKGDDVFTVVTTGKIASAEDTKFSDFIPVTEAEDSHEKETIKKGKKQVLSLEAEDDDGNKFTQTVNADANWTQAGSGMWLCGGNAVLNLNGFYLKKDNPLLEQNVLLRLFMESQGFYYTDWQNTVIRTDKGNLKINGIRYGTNGKNIMRDIRVFAKFNSEIYCTCVFSGFDKNYLANRGYFDSIIKSYLLKK